MMFSDTHKLARAKKYSNIAFEDDPKCCLLTVWYSAGQPHSSKCAQFTHKITSELPIIGQLCGPFVLAAMA